MAVIEFIGHDADHSSLLNELTLNFVEWTTALLYTIERA
jgi:hypothetical protein